MKSMNFFVSAGALIFLLLDVRSTYGYGKGYGVPCDALDFADAAILASPTATEAEKAPVYAKALLQCMKDGNIVYSSTEKGGKCECAAPSTWDAADKTCKVGGTGGATGDKVHGEACTAKEDCQEPTECRVNGKTGKPADKPGTEWTAGATNAICVCLGGTTYDSSVNECKKGGTKKKHGDACMATGDCQEPTTCRVNGETGKPADKPGTEWTAGATNAICVCLDGTTLDTSVNECKKGTTGGTKKKHGDACMATGDCEEPTKCREGGDTGKPDKPGTELKAGAKNAKCVCLDGTTLDKTDNKCKKLSGTTDPGKKPNSSGSDLIACQSIALLLTMVAIGIGSLLFICRP